MVTKAGGWSGRKVTSARAYWRRRLPLPCRRCGRPVVHDPVKRNGGWNVGHIVDRAQGGSDHVTNQWPEHETCNLRAGGKEGARITNARRPATRTALQSERDRGIRGI